MMMTLRFQISILLLVIGVCSLPDLIAQPDRADSMQVSPAVLQPSIRYEKVYEATEGMNRVRKEGYFGFIRAADKKEIVPPTFERAWDFSEGLALVQQEGRFGYINPDGQIVIPIRYDQAQSVQDGMALVRLNGKSGFFDAAGRSVVPLMYDEAWPYFNGKAYVRKGAEWIYINKRGEIIEKAD